jgi:hypothetical protein
MNDRTLERFSVHAANPDQVEAVNADFGGFAGWHPHLPP